jgi:hypothetical protein
MNDLLFHYRHHILWEGGFRTCSLDDILHKVNNMPQRNIGWAYSTSMARELLAQGGRQAS